MMKFQRLTSQPENPFADLIPNQPIAVVPSFTLESGATLYNVPIAYTTRGKLNERGDNVMVICHALTGSADVADWWGPLIGGPGKAFDVTRFFVVCMNSLGSPYGTASPVTSKDGDPSKGPYGPEFPLTTVRDDVRLFKVLLDDLGVKQIAAVIGGSMGGMLVLEFAYFGKDYVRCIVPIATSARHSAWCISWGEAQRQSIYSDPKYEDGYYPYEDPPASGLGAARMSALLTYRSRDSFESRFGRNTPDPSRRQNINGTHRPTTPGGNEHFEIHNEGHKHAGMPRFSVANSPSASTPSSPHPSSTTSQGQILFGDTGGAASTAAAESSSTVQSQHTEVTVTDPQFHGATPLPTPLKPMNNNSSSIGNSGGLTSFGTSKRAPTYFSAQSYLRYQGEKFIRRFDANCYIAITRKLDTHDVSLHWPPPEGDLQTPHPQQSPPSPEQKSPTTTSHPPQNHLHQALSLVTQPTLILGILSDGLFTFAEQQELASHIPDSRLEKIESPEGHDAFLLQFEQVNASILGFLRDVLPDVWEGVGWEGGLEGLDEGEGGEVGVSKSSTFGEAEVEDITAW